MKFTKAEANTIEQGLKWSMYYFERLPLKLESGGNRWPSEAYRHQRINEVKEEHRAVLIKLPLLTQKRRGRKHITMKEKAERKRERKKKIKELQENGLSLAQISKEIGIAEISILKLMRRKKRNKR